MLGRCRRTGRGACEQAVDAKEAELKEGYWRIKDATVSRMGREPEIFQTYLLSTYLTPERVADALGTVISVSFWELPRIIEVAEKAKLSAERLRIQYELLLSRPLLLASMVLIAAAFSLRFFRFGGVQKMVLGGVAAGFLIYVGSKLTDDLSKAEMISPIVAAWLPAVVGGLGGFLALLYLEDG